MHHPSFRHRFALPFSMLAMVLLSLTLQVSAQDSTPSAAVDGSNAIAYLDNDYLIVHDLDTDTRQNLESPSFYIYDVTPMGDGRLVYNFGGGLYLWDGTNKTDISPPDNLQIFSVATNDAGQLALILRLQQDMENTQIFRLYLWDEGAYTNLGQTVRDGVIAWSADGRLAFESTQDGNYEIYVWAAGELTNVTNSRSADTNPAWSADGRLAFESSRDGAAEIYVWDGTTTINVSQSNAWDENPTWSRDGHLAFTSSRDGIRTLFVWDGDTLTDLGQADGHFLTWSADNRLAFTTYRDGSRELYIWENGVSTNISQSAGEEWQPTWSADGRLAFTSYHDNIRELFVWDGSTLNNVGQWNHVSNLTWNIDGRLAFNANAEIYVWDGASVTNVTNTPNGYESAPHWLLP